MASQQRHWIFSMRWKSNIKGTILEFSVHVLVDNVEKRHFNSSSFFGEISLDSLFYNYICSTKLRSKYRAWKKMQQPTITSEVQFCVSSVEVVLSRSTRDRLKPGRTWNISANRMINYGIDDGIDSLCPVSSGDDNPHVRQSVTRHFGETSILIRFQIFGRSAFICSAESLFSRSNVILCLTVLKVPM